MSDFVIDGRRIGVDHPPFAIAEMSGNHNGSLDRAIEIVRAAAATGASAVKLQTYRPDTITLDCRTDEFLIKNEESLWFGRYLYDLYSEAHTPWEWHHEIFAEARRLSIICFSSPFDETAVDFLEELGAPAYKIASFELVHLPLIRKVAATGKPMIMSTGLADVGEIEEAVAAARSVGNQQIILLKCTSTYPARLEDCHLSTIPDMRERFGTQVGFSDHTLGVQASAEAVKRYGATVVEKHFTLSETQDGVDEAFSLGPDDMRELVEACNRGWKHRKDAETGMSSVTHGVPTYGGTAREASARLNRPSVWFSRAMSDGETVGREDLIVRRPGRGLAPKHLDQLLGRRLNRSVVFGEPTDWALFSDA